jgi:hypothetical protein
MELRAGAIRVNAQIKLGLFAWVTVALLLSNAQVTRAQASYNIRQITTGTLDHKWPSINNKGDIVWSQQMAGMWQVIECPTGCPTGTGTPISVPDNSHNFRYPDISDAGDIVYLKDQVGPGVGLEVILNHGGSEGIVEFSSFDPTSGAYRNAGQHFGISGNGTIVSYYDFCNGSGTCFRRIDVSGKGQLSGNFPGEDFFDINDQKTFAFSSSSQVFTAPVANPTSVTSITKNGSMPRLANSLPGSSPEIVYIQSGQVVSTIGGVIDLGLWADVNDAGTIVYEKVVSGNSQIFVATRTNKLSIAPTAIAFGSAQPGKVRSGRFIIKNISTSVVTGTISSPSMPFSVTSGGSSFSLSPGQTQSVSVAFQPTSSGTFNDSVVVTPIGGSPMSVPLSGTADALSTVTVWIDAFIPYPRFGLLTVLPASFILTAPGLTYPLSQVDIAGDGRSFANDPTASFRVQWLETFDAATLAPIAMSGSVGPSHLVLDSNGLILLSATPSAAGVTISPPVQVGSLVYVTISGGAKFGFLDGVSAVPAINANATFRIDLVNRTCQLVGTFGGFPAFEAYIQPNGDTPVPLLQSNVGPEPGWPIFILGLFSPNHNTITGTSVPF